MHHLMEHEKKHSNWNMDYLKKRNITQTWYATELAKHFSTTNVYIFNYKESTAPFLQGNRLAQCLIKE